jgi:hypothetical protein
VLAYSRDNIIPVGKAENRVVLIIPIVVTKIIRKVGLSAAQRNDYCLTLRKSVSQSDA